MSTNNISDFYHTLRQEIIDISTEDAYGWEGQDYFTEVMLEYLEEAGEIEDPVICPFRSYGLQLNAYWIAEDYSEVIVFVSVYKDSDELQTVSKTDVDVAIKRGIQLYRKAVNDLYTSFEKDNDTYQFAISLHDHVDDIKKVRIVSLIDGLVKGLELSPIELNGVEISFSIWDIDRLFKCMISGKKREIIEIDFEKEFGESIDCLENNSSDKYSAYLCILKGDVHAGIYEKHGERLLERNVRSFLQVKGAVNKGIRDTLKNEPEMFLAYNNGISVTAESIEIVRDDNGKPSISKIRDMQIVNGGQTTASIYNASKDKKLDVDLSRVFVQMKLSVINNAHEADEIVPKISAFANTQNKIQMADFSANDPFHRKIEEISRTVWTPSQNGGTPKNWFYERARGQYADALSKETTAIRRKQFKEIHPVFTKTDLAKYENTWDQYPYWVSDGAQKNFKRFTVRLNDRGKFVPDTKYYERLIGKAILYKRTEKLVQEQQYGGYRANIVTYTLAYLSYITSQRINLDRIWNEQGLTSELEGNIIELSKIVHELIINPPGGQNIGEWCKKVDCWNAIKECGYKITDGLKKELIDLSYQKLVVSASNSSTQSSINTVTEEEKEAIKKVSSIPANTWFALSKWAKETDNFQGWQRGIVFSVGTLVSRKKLPSYKQAKYALAAYDEAVSKGFKTE